MTTRRFPPEIDRTDDLPQRWPIFLRTNSRQLVKRLVVCGKATLLPPSGPFDRYRAVEGLTEYGVRLPFWIVYHEPGCGHYDAGVQKAIEVLKWTHTASDAEMAAWSQEHRPACDDVTSARQAFMNGFVREFW